jgi:hypothetical protein
MLLAIKAQFPAEEGSAAGFPGTFWFRQARLFDIGMMI